jgi:hypothetical protein
MQAQARQLPRPATTRRRIHVVAESAADVVCEVGGWLFDHTSAGWDATVRLVSGDESDHRCLRILGAHSAPMTVYPDADAGPIHAIMVAIRPHFARHPVLHDALNQGLHDVLLFGGTPRRALGIDLSPECHTLSVAARAFKRHAAIALGVPGAIDDRSEGFWRAALRSAPTGELGRHPTVSDRN